LWWYSSVVEHSTADGNVPRLTPSAHCESKANTENVVIIGLIQFHRFIDGFDEYENQFHPNISTCLLSF